MRGDRDCRIYVGNLPKDVAEYELVDIFDRWRPLRDISIKSRMGSSAFAFITFDHPDDAADAVHYKDGSHFANGRLRVELVKGPGGAPDRGGRGGRGATRRGDFRVIVSGIPKSGSWQDLKDHMREAGDVVFTNIDRDGTGVVEFSSANDMRYALDKMQDTPMRSRSGETSRITIKEDIEERDGSPRRDDDRDRPRDDDRRDRSPRRDDDRRDRSPRRDDDRRDRSPRRDDDRRDRSPRRDDDRRDRSPSRRDDDRDRDGDERRERRDSRSPGPDTRDRERDERDRD